MNIETTERRCQNSIVIDILRKSKSKICHYLKINYKQFDITLNSFKIRSKLSGYNNQVYLIDFFDDEGELIGAFCLKYSEDDKNKSGLILEAKILKLLYSNKVGCPKLIHSGVLTQDNVSYIVTEVVRGTRVIDSCLDIEAAQIIFNVIKSHELILHNNIKTFDSLPIMKNLYQKIDFEKKISLLIKSFVPNLVINESLRFLNHYLNNKYMINGRTIVTDRTPENIFKDQNNNIILIDFSTIRIGSEFDNWIQFIDYPQLHHLCEEEDLFRLFFKNKNISIKNYNFFYTASIYTNLLQGIFTYNKNHKLGMRYFKNVNDSFEKLMKNKSVLIDFRH